MIAAVYDAPPLPERETVPARLLRIEWEEAASSGCPVLTAG